MQEDADDLVEVNVAGVQLTKLYQSTGREVVTAGTVRRPTVEDDPRRWNNDSFYLKKMQGTRGIGITMRWKNRFTHEF
ncbi:MAG: hypothetical protein MPW14_03200 [Candidatus Manganitrophus sp.]|nr:hypothetical protein [Candidatus Manganitrophus sp.]WDT80807.1 MAG: hypothetical protein MPW14_03200 [Candidatus Manganitrophus sp.]